MAATPVPASRWEFLRLTVLLVGWMLMAPRLADRWLVQALLQAFLLYTVAVTLGVHPGWRRLRRLAIGCWVLALAGSLLAVLPLPARWQHLGRIAELAFILPLLVLLSIGILGFVFQSRRWSSDGVFATIVVYLLIALLFAQLYLLMLQLDPGSFTLPAAAGDRSPDLLQSDMLYFSLVTLATVGYGDILPHGETARMVAMLEAVIGQFYVAVIVAVFVGMHMSHRGE